MADARGGVNAQLQRRAIRHAVYWQRLRAQQVRDAVGFLNGEVIAPLHRRLEERLAAIEARGSDGGPATTLRMQELEFALRDLVADGMARGEARLTENLAAVGNYEAEWQAAAMRGLVPIEWDFLVPAPGQIRAALVSKPFEGRVLGEWWKGVATDTQQRMSRELRAGFSEGQTTPQIVSRIIGDEKQRGALGLARHQVESITRTATTHIATEARNATFEENDDIVEGWQFVATLDSRTSLICASEDGKVYKLGEGRQPPLHWGCRSTTTPVLKSWKDLGIPIKELPPGTRASMNGEVPEKTTYEEWLRGESKSVQVDALGTTRAAAFRGGAPLSRFVTRDGRPLSIAELRAADALN